MGRNFYPAGSVIQAALKGTDSYEECRFSYRPMTSGQRGEALNRLAATRDEVKASEIGMGLIAAHVAGWDIEREDGSMVDPKDFKALKHVPPLLLADIAQVILDGTLGNLALASSGPEEPDSPDSAGADLGN